MKTLDKATLAKIRRALRLAETAIDLNGKLTPATQERADLAAVSALREARRSLANR